MAKQTRQTAKQAYKTKAACIKTAMIELQARLDKHAEQAHEVGHNWGDVGDLGYVDEKLCDMLESFMSGGE